MPRGPAICRGPGRDRNKVISCNIIIINSINIISCNIIIMNAVHAGDLEGPAEEKRPSLSHLFCMYLGTYLGTFGKSLNPFEDVLSVSQTL